jgi:hypothetical protein
MPEFATQADLLRFLIQSDEEQIAYITQRIESSRRILARLTHQTENRRPSMPDPLTLSVSVTAEDIAEGVPRSRCACPIANAVVRALHAAGLTIYDVQVSRCDLILGNEHTYRLFPIPQVAIDFIDAFDTYGSTDPLAPFDFTIDLGSLRDAS